MQFLLDFANQILDFINSGIYDFVTKVLAQFVISASIAMVKTKIFIISVSWGVAQQVLIQLNISDYINQAWGYLDSKTLMLVTFFRLPEALNIIISARLTRFVIDFMGF